jgi:hypothetical protein
MRRVLRARLVCSDGNCAVLYEAYGRAGDIDALGCDCGCGLQVLGWPEAVAARPGEESLVLVALDG